MAAIVRTYLTTASKLSSLNVKDGQLIFVKDTKQIYLDSHGLRLNYSAIQCFKTDQDRQNLIAPVEGFYYVENTNELWRYSSSQWKQLTQNENPPIYFGNFQDFPKFGDPKILYISNNEIYRWDSLTSQYIQLNKQPEWNNIKENNL